LAERQCKVRERFRTSLTDEETLRVIEAPTEETSAVRTETPRQLEMEQS